MSDIVKIASALGTLAADALNLLDAQLEALHVPSPICEAIWKEVARRATQNAEDCRESNNASS